MRTWGFALERMGSHWRVVSLGLVFWKSRSGCCVENRLWVGKARKKGRGLGGRDDRGLDQGVAVEVGWALVRFWTFLESRNNGVC